MDSAYRASWCKIILHEFLAYPGNPVTAGKSELPAGVQELIESTIGVGWISHTEYSKLLEFMGVALPLEQFKDCWCRIITKTSSLHPIGKSMLAAAAKILGLTPYTLCRTVNATWTTLTRDSGLMASVKTDDGCRLTLSDYPIQFFTPTLVAAFEGGFRAFISLCGMPGSVTTGQVDKAAGRVEYIFKF